jgi:putative hemolysin
MGVLSAQNVPIKSPSINMSDLSRAALWILLIGFLAHSGLFSAAETALFSLDRIRLTHIQHSHPRGYLYIQMLLNTPHTTLTSILLLNRFINTGAAISAGALAKSYLAGSPILGFLSGAAGVTFLILMLGEIMPKTLAIERAETLALLCSPLLLIYIWLTTPLRLIIGFINNLLFRLFKIPPARNTDTSSEEDLKMMLMSGELDTLLEDDEKEMIDGVFELRQKTGEEIMTPRTALEAYPDTLSQEEMVESVRKGSHNRILIYSEDLDHIIGTLHIKDLLLHPNHPYTDLVREPYLVPPKKELTTLLRDMQKSHIHLAIVVDEYGGTAGIVTLHDLLEEIVGEIKDAKEAAGEQKDIIRIEPDHYHVAGKIDVSRLNETYSLGLDEGIARTIGGYILNLLGRLPAEGEEFESSGWRFQIMKMDGNRIDRISMRKIPTGNGESPAGREGTS